MSGVRSVLKLAHDDCRHNADYLEKSATCGCFYCCEVFTPREIMEYIHSGMTAVCPKCGINSVIPGSWFRGNLDFLYEMHNHWFRKETDN